MEAGTFLTATQRGTQQQEPEELQPDSEPPDSGRMGRQGQVPRDAVVTFSTFRANNRTNYNRLPGPLKFPVLPKVPTESPPGIPVVVIVSGTRNLILNDYA